MLIRLSLNRLGSCRSILALAFLAPLAAGASGCWRQHDTAVDYSLVPLENANAPAGSIWVRAYDTNLACPDGEYASFYAVWDELAPEPAPVAIVFHSGAFDYVSNPAAEDPTIGTHYATVNRLSAAWAKERVFFTLGMWSPDDEKTEQSTGAIATALAQSGALAIYPANCWGDLWHNEKITNKNDYRTDGFYREGLTFAWWMTQLIVNQAFASAQDFTPPVRVDGSKLYLFGLGDGGRAVGEVLLRATSIQSSDVKPVFGGVFVDSSPDDLSYYLINTQYTQQIRGLQRIFYEDSEPYGHYSLLNYLGGTPLKGGRGSTGSYVVPSQMDIIWSSQDSIVADDMIEPMATRASALGGKVTDTQLSGHVFSSSSITIANDVVNEVFSLNR
jgi:hypothetical protein